MAVDPVSLAITAGLMAAQMALTATQKIKGPRLDDLNVSLADYGTPIPRIWGTRRINPQIMWAEKLREKKKKSKTKGGKYTEYKYYGTWAVLLCDHEIDAVTRIWFDKRLIYQRTSAGPVSAAAAAIGSTLGQLGESDNIKLASGQNMRIYLGTEDQEPDPRIEAWCEDRYGPDSCPAYRGSAYIVFEDIPLETVGNRIPQISVELVNNPNNAYPYETKDTAHPFATSNSAFRFGGTWAAYVYDVDGQVEWWDVPARKRLGVSTPPDVSFSGDEPAAALAQDGTCYQYGYRLNDPFLGVNHFQVVTSPLGAPTVTWFDGTSFQMDVARVLESNGSRRVYCNYVDATGYISGQTHVDSDQSGRDFCIDSEGVDWGVFQPDDTSTDFSIRNLSGVGGVYNFTALTSHVGLTPARICHVPSSGSFFVWMDDKFYIVDDATMTMTASGALALSYTPELWEQTPGPSTFWDVVNFNEYSLSDGSQVQNLDQTDWTAGFTLTGGYEPINDAIWSRDNPDIEIRFLGRIGGNGVTLQTVVDDVSEWVGVSGQDSAALTQTVEGYSITLGQAKTMLAPLLDIHDVDARPHDFTVQFKNRGSAPSGSIATVDLVRDNGPRYTVTVQQDTDLPQRVTFTFADRDHDQQSNTVIAQRPLDATASKREEPIDLSTYVDTPDSAQQKADRYFRRAWNSRERTKASLTYQKIGLEPGDVTTIELDGHNRNVRIDKQTIGLNQITCEFVRDETSFAAVNTATTGADMEGRDDEEIYIPGPVQGFVIDGPFAEDVDSRSNPIIYYLAGPMAGAFSGAVVAEGDSLGAYDETVGAIDSSSDANWGIANTVLATANPNLWDRGNEFNVNVLNGPLTSVTEADINADPSLNLAALGEDGRWEYLNFATATLESDGSYTLSDLKRGRRGTEVNVGNHAIGDMLVLLDNRVIDERGVSDIGDDLSFKVQAPLRPVEAAPPIELDYDANCLKPYAPCHLSASKSTDVTISWIRRTRLGGAWVGGSTIPLSEASESYEIDIYVGVTFKRTLTSSSPSKVYTAAQMTTDGTGSGFTAKLYQISATVGRGFENSTTFAF